jgi:mediator of RNA polymerase II transcription subunit 12
VRSYLEDFGDLSVLADIIGIVATSLDANVLASAADTLHYHLKSFRAIGAFETLFGKLAARYAAIRTVRFPERELLISLTDLSRAAQATGPLMQALVADLSRYDHMPSAAVCSPVSDTTAEVNNGTVIDSDEDIDRILSSGTSMDQQIMARVFDKIWANLEQQCSKNSSPSGYHASWFHRLRTFDEKYFEAILLERLRFLLSSQKAELKHAVVPALVASGCFTLPDLLMVARDCVNKRKTSSQEEALQISLDVLDVILPSSQLSDLCQAQEAYRYRLEQRKFCHEPGDHILRFLGETLEFGAMVLTQASQSRLERMLSSDQVRAIVKHFALKNAQSLCDHLGIGSSSYSDSTFSCLRSLLDSLLDPSHSLGMHIQYRSLKTALTLATGLSQKSTVEKVKTIVEAADPLSLPFCQIQIRLLFSMNVGIVDTTSGALLEAIKVAVEKNQSPWFELVAGLDNGLINKVRCNLLVLKDVG